MRLYLSIQTPDGVVANVPISPTGLQIEAAPGSVYKVIEIDGIRINSANVTVTRDGRDLTINGIAQADPVVILDFFLACRFDTACKLELFTIGGDRSEVITPLSESQSTLADGNFLLWSAVPSTVSTLPVESSPVMTLNPYVVGGLAIGAIAIAGGAGANSGNPVGSDPAPAPAPEPSPPPPPPPSDPIITLDAVLDDVGPNVGRLASGASTDDETPTLQGSITGDLGNDLSVRVVRDGEVLSAGSMDNAQFSFTDSVDDDGDYVYQLIVINRPGDVISVSDEIMVTVDTDAPDQPEIYRVEGNNIISNREALDGVLVAGSAETNTSVSVVWGNQTRTSQTDADGDWAVTFNQIPVAGGFSSIQASVTDAAGNQSDSSIRTVIVRAPTAGNAENDDLSHYANDSWNPQFPLFGPESGY